MPAFRGKPRASFALLDPVTPQIGLFRALPDRPGRRPAASGDGAGLVMERAGVTHEYRAAGPLGPVEWRTLLAVYALAGLAGERVGCPADSAVVEATGPEGQAAAAPSIRVRTTMYALLREVGVGDSGRTRTRLVESLKRLASVRLFLSRGTRTLSAANLLSFGADERTGELMIGLSPDVAAPILGEARQYAFVSLDEVRALSSPAAVILHAVLSARVDRGGTCRYGVDTIGDVVYGPTTDAATRRKRRGRVRAAVAELGRLADWQTSADGEVVTVHRLPRRPCDQSRTAVRLVTPSRATGHALTSPNSGGPPRSAPSPNASY
jgi:hypothetical protein